MNEFKDLYKVDWKERYDALAKLTQALVDGQRALEFQISRVLWHLQESDRLSLLERGMHRFKRVKKTVTLSAEWADDGRSYGQEREFKEGTLLGICTDTLYLDDTNAFYQFPKDSLEVVELDSDNVDWEAVVSVG